MKPKNSKRGGKRRNVGAPKKLEAGKTQAFVLTEEDRDFILTWRLQHQISGSRSLRHMLKTLRENLDWIDVGLPPP